MSIKAAEKAKTQERIIGRWTIGDTLGKGGYSWVKRGQDIKTGKIVALKFMEKADVSWVKEQAKQVETEIEALKNIRHQNVMKLYAYNLNAQYPLAEDDKQARKKEQEYIDTILLVLEYAPGGELFDILYYTSSLGLKVARTYFKQIVAGLEACHNNGVVHRDLKPQNLLLDAKYNIKITDFGLSKIIQSDADAIMKTSYVGTRGYQAPELLLKQKYDLKCDIFSVGVILFILLAGYPPFEQANKNDKWFRPLLANKIEKFWKAHSKSPLFQNEDAKDLLTSMLAADPKQRTDIAGIKSHKWFKGPTLKQKEVIVTLRERHREAEKKRRQDARKMNDLAHSINPMKPIRGLKEVQMELFPETETEGILCDVYTYGLEWMDIYNLLDEAINEKGQGSTVFNFEKKMLNGTLKMMDNNKVEQEVTFTIRVWESRFWQNRYKQDDAFAEIEESKEDKIWVVRINRLSGDPLMFRKLKNQFLFLYCSSILRGLPKWARQMQEADIVRSAAAAAKKAKSASSAVVAQEKKAMAVDDEKQPDNVKMDVDVDEEPDDYDAVVGSYKWDVFPQKDAVAAN